MEESASSLNASPAQTIYRTLDGNKSFDFDLANLPFRSLFYGFSDIGAPLSVLILIFGVVANTLNIIVFTRIGAKDNVTVSFLALTMSDLTHLVLMAPHIVISFIEHTLVYRLGVKIQWLLDRQILSVPFYWYAFVFYETSILITVYISVVRCACVAMPLQLKSTFTVRRTIIAFIAFFVSTALLRVPMFMRKQITREYDKMTNTSQIVYKDVEDGGLADLVNDIVSRNLLTWTSFVIVVSCVVVMVTKLRASAKFRSSVSVCRPEYAVSSNTDNVTRTNAETNSDAQDSNLTPTKIPIAYLESTQNFDAKPQAPQATKAMSITEAHRPLTGIKPLAAGNTCSSSKEKTQVLSARERQVVRSVVLVAVVFITCQIPYMAYSLARRLESQFDDYEENIVPKYIYLFAFCAHLSKLFSTLNASVNILVYYRFNSRYKQCMRGLCNQNKK